MYERYTVQTAPVFKPEHVAILAGSAALVVIVMLVKGRKKKRRKK